MKQLILSIFLLIATLLPCTAQQSSVENPILLGSILLDQTSLDKMVDLCKWYRLVELPSDEDSRAYKTEDSTLIKFSMSADNTTPYVEVHTTKSKKKIEKTLVEAGYHKEKERYEKGSRYATTYNTCKIIGSKKSA